MKKHGARSGVLRVLSHLAGRAVPLLCQAASAVFQHEFDLHFGQAARNGFVTEADLECPIAECVVGRWFACYLERVRRSLSAIAAHGGRLR